MRFTNEYIIFILRASFKAGNFYRVLDFHRKPDQ
jgi:hypothetical protein